MKLLSRFCSFVAASGLIAAAVAGAGAARAQDYPSRPITLVVPYSAGGSADILARAIGQKLSEKLGQAVVIENKAGAGTAIGARFAAEAPADGYTLLMGTVSSHAINPAMTKVGYDPIRDFAVVAPVASIPFVLVTKPDSGYKSVSDVVAAAKQSPDSLSYASAGPGTSNHLAGEMLAASTGTKLVHIPYKGSAPALADVLAGHVPLMFDLQSTSIPNIREGKLRALAVTSEQRSSLLPDVPTMAEAGVPGYEVSAWFAVFAPAKVPAPVIQRLSRDVTDIMRSAPMEQRLRELGASPDTRTAAAFTAYLKEEVAKYATVVKNAGLAP